MADTIVVDNGANPDFTVATDEITVDGYATLAQVQLVKLVSGVNGETAPVGADTNTTSKAGLYVVAHRQAKRIAVPSAGLTIATTTYTGTDQVGNEFQFVNAARYAAGTGLITNVVLIDKADIIGAYDVVISRASLTLAGDNAVWAVSDADALNILAMVQLDVAIDLGGNRIAQAQGIAIPFDCAATTLFASLITRSNHSFFAAATDLQLAFMIQQD